MSTNAGGQICSKFAITRPNLDERLPGLRRHRPLLASLNPEMEQKSIDRTRTKSARNWPILGLLGRRSIAEFVLPRPGQVKNEMLRDNTLPVIARSSEVSVVVPEIPSAAPAEHKRGKAL